MDMADQHAVDLSSPIGWVSLYVRGVLVITVHSETVGCRFL